MSWKKTDDWDGKKSEDDFSVPDELIGDTQHRRGEHIKNPGLIRGREYQQEAAIRRLIALGMAAGAKDEATLLKAINDHVDDPVRDVVLISGDQKRAKIWLERLRDCERNDRTNGNAKRRRRQEAIDRLVRWGMAIGARSKSELRRAIEYYRKDPLADTAQIQGDDRRAKDWLERLRKAWQTDHDRSDRETATRKKNGKTTA